MINIIIEFIIINRLNGCCWYWTVLCWDLKLTKYLKYFQTSLVIDHEMNHQNGDNSLWLIHIIIYLNKAWIEGDVNQICRRFNTIMPNIRNCACIHHYNCYQNKALLRYIIICINHKLLSPFWWFISWSMTREVWKYFHMWWRNQDQMHAEDNRDSTGVLECCCHVISRRRTLTHVYISCSESSKWW
jgi:hypothetical protein